MILLASLVALGGCHRDSAEAAALYAGGNFAAAASTMAEHVQADPQGVSAGWLLNLARARLATGDERGAESAAEWAAARGGGNFYADRDFLFGEAAWARSRRAEIETLRPGAPPQAFDLVISEVKRAFEAWKSVVAREDDPAARRNAERCARELARLELLRSEAESNQPKGEPPPPPPDENPPGEEEVEATPPEASSRPLSALELQEVLDRLAAKEKERRKVRRAEQNRRAPGAGQGL